MTYKLKGLLWVIFALALLAGVWAAVWLYFDRTYIGVVVGLIFGTMFATPFMTIAGGYSARLSKEEVAQLVDISRNDPRFHDCPEAERQFIFEFSWYDFVLHNWFPVQMLMRSSEWRTLVMSPIKKQNLQSALFGTNSRLKFNCYGRYGRQASWLLKNVHENDQKQSLIIANSDRL